MQETGRSTLASKTGILVGSGFGPHPKDPQRSMNVVVYRTDDQWVICLAEVEGCGDPESQRSALGSTVPGRLFAPYAARGIGSEMAYANVRDLLGRSTPGMEMHWLAEADLKASGQ